MKVVILEDEPLAAEKLSRYLSKYSADMEILQVLDALETAIPWIREHQTKADLFFMDIQLIDGLSFEIFSQVQLNKPVIFTTAFDEFAIDAFKVNSIDYLLKPITFTDLSRALRKLESLKEQFSKGTDIAPLVPRLRDRTYKDRFLVRVGNHIHSVASVDIAYFHAEGRDVFLVNSEGRRYLVEYTLETLEELLFPKQFFRINRSFIVQLNTIDDVVVYANRRLKLSLRPKTDREVVVSREKVGAFKQWFEGI